ncbi:MAG: type 4a pilus biogenesis protein PilO [Candidatus Omnitrophota bacterium]
MKKINLIINLAAGVFLLLMILVSLWQFNTTIILRRTFAEKKKELKAAKVASRRLEKLAEQSQDLQQKEGTSYKRIPVNEKQPLGLMKALMRLGGEIGLKEMSLNVSSGNQINAGFGTGAGLIGGADQAGSEKTRPKPKPVYIQMDCEGTFSHLLAFLEQLLNLERLVAVEKVTIERKEKILPYQQISLEIVTYTY